MQQTQRANFGRKGLELPNKPPKFTKQKSRWVTPGLMVAFAVLICAGLWSVYPSIWARIERSIAASSQDFPLSGLWAVEGRSCADASVFLELDGNTLTTVSAVGRIPIGTYSTTGTNPLTLTLSDGSQIVWDTTDRNKLVPLSLSPKKDSLSERLTLSRC